MNSWQGKHNRVAIQQLDEVCPEASSRASPFVTRKQAIRSAAPQLYTQRVEMPLWPLQGTRLLFMKAIKHSLTTQKNLGKKPSHCIAEGRVRARGLAPVSPAQKKHLMYLFHKTPRNISRSFHV